MSRPEALMPAQQAERLARELDDRPALARALRVLASIYILAGNLDAAARSVEASHRDQPGDRQSHRRNRTASTTPRTSTARLGDVEKAIALYERAMPLALATQRSRLEATLLNNLGSAYSGSRRVREGAAPCTSSRSPMHGRRTIPGRNTPRWATSEAIHLKLGNLTKARELRSSRWTIARKSGDAQWESRELNGIGLDLFRGRRVREALDYHRKRWRSAADRRRVRSGVGAQCGGPGLAAPGSPRRSAWRLCGRR